MKFTTILSALFYTMAGICLVPAALGLVDTWFYAVYGITVTGLAWEPQQIIGSLVLSMCAICFAGLGSFSNS